jgi:hypothetical protein
MIYDSIKRESLNTVEYLRELLAYQCMPTLLKLKPASLVTVDKRLVPNLQDLYSFLQINLGQYGCHYLTFQETEYRLYLLLYNEHLLWQSMTAGLRQPFIESYGYPVRRDQLERALSQLGKRYRNYWITGEFPHEIGIFLGYPLADVESFIRYSGKYYIICGMWKVYGRVQVAEAAFTCFHQLKARAVKLTETKGELLHLCKEETDRYNQILWELLSY